MAGVKIEAKWVLLAAVLVAVAGFLFLSQPSDEREPFVVKGDLGFLSTILEANTVIVRAVYPFSDAQGAVGAITYASAVLTAKGKKVILQSFEGNVCYTNEGNTELVVQKPVEDCLLPYPVIEVREGSGIIEVSPEGVYISGPPEYLLPAVSFILKKIYPDADQVYYQVFAAVNLQ